MALSYQLDNLDSLTDSIKGFYTEKDGKFTLGVEGLPDQSKQLGEYETRINSMDSKIAELLKEKKGESLKRKEAESLAASEAAELARKNGDTAALEASWQTKYDAKVTELDGTISALNGSVHKMTVDKVADVMAAQITIDGSESIVAAGIKLRLATEMRDGVHVTIVNDLQGRPSALTLEELKNEFISNPAYARLIVGSKASGGGATSSNGGAVSKTLKRADFANKSPGEQMAFVKDGGTITD